MTESLVHDTPRRMGRKLEYPDRITLPLAEGVTKQIDDLVAGTDETRLDLIREAIGREIKRRSRMARFPPGKRI